MLYDGREHCFCVISPHLHNTLVEPHMHHGDIGARPDANMAMPPGEPQQESADGHGMLLLPFSVFSLVCLSLQCLKIITRPPHRDSLAALTAPQPDGLTVLLQLGNELVTLLDYVCVLLVLVVGSVGLDDALDAVDRAGYAVGGDESSEVPSCC